MRKPVKDAVIAIVTTAGVHLNDQPPFDMADPDGDPSYRVVPVDTPPDRLTITHKYYDHKAADRDRNVVLPIDRLREMTEERRIAGVAPRAYAFMGHIDGRHVKTLINESAPEVARRLAQDRADAILLTPA